MRTNRTPMLLMCLLACLILPTCGSHRDGQDRLPLDGIRAVYLQARDNKDGMWSGEFADIWLVDLAKRNLHRVTDDSFYDDSPLWFPDGRAILFLSNRVGRFSELKVQGIGGPHQLFRMELESKKLERVDEAVRSRYPRIIRGFYQCLQIHPDQNSLLFRSGNVIYRFSFGNDSAWIVLDLDSLLRSRNEALFDFRISPDTSVLVFEALTEGGNKIRADLGISSLLSGSTRFIPYFDGGHFGGWSRDGKRVLITGPLGLRELVIGPDTLKQLTGIGDSISTSPNSAAYIDSTRILFLGGKLRATSETQRAETEIIVFDVLGKEFEYLTHDGNERSSLSLFTPRK